MCIACITVLTMATKMSRMGRQFAVPCLLPARGLAAASFRFVSSDAHERSLLTRDAQHSQSKDVRSLIPLH
jgi:hypothetical protein